MQLSLRPYVTAGVAIVGASVIAATPITPTPTQLASEIQAIQSSSAAVELTALADTLNTSSFVDPIGYWAEVLATTQTNVGKLVDAASADPFPVLSQIVENQTRYANTIGTALSGAAEGLQSFAAKVNERYLPEVINALSQGELQAAAQEIKFALTDFGIALYPMIPLLSMPYQMAQNVANVFETMAAEGANTGIIGKPAFGLLNVAGTMVYAVATVGQEIIDAAEAGDPVAAMSAVVNAPAFLTDSLLNGQAVVRPNGSIYRTPGLLKLDAVTNTAWSLGSALLVHIPQAIAAAITPPATSTATATAEPDSAPFAGDVASLPTTAADGDATPRASASADTVTTVTTGLTDAVKSINRTATSAIDAAKSVMLKVEPQTEVNEVSTAAAASTSEAAANPSVDAADESPDTSKTAAVKPADAADNAANVSEVNADKKSKTQTRKEARAAKRQERQEAKAERQQARQQAKAGKQSAKAAKTTGGKHRTGKSSSSE